MATPQHDTPITLVPAPPLPTWYAPVKRHGGRVAALADRIVAACDLPARQRQHVYYAALWHDIGKLSLGPRLVNKPGPLSGPEWTRMRRHPRLGALYAYGLGLPLAIAEMIDAHHERWDGRGYGRGLARHQIPLGAQIIALADAFDAMTSDRSYRRAMGAGAALERMAVERERAFHPELLVIALAVFGAAGPAACLAA